MNLERLIKNLKNNEIEVEFLKERFKEMSVKERYILEGAIELNEISNTAALINLTEQLYKYDLYHKATDEKSLGEYVARYKEYADDEILKFIDTKKIGKEYHEDYQGVFTDKGYIIQKGRINPIYDGSNIEELSMGVWTVKLKLSSKYNHEGVWVNLPDYELPTGEPDELSTGEADELTLAFEVLGITKIKEAILENAKCIFLNIKGLKEQYEAIEGLLIHGNILGYVLDESDDDKGLFLEHFQAAMELEKCARLDYALDISQNLKCYDYLSKKDGLEAYGRFIANRDNIVKEGTILGDNFDYIKYAKAYIDREEFKPCKYGFIKRNGAKFLYQFSEEPKYGK